MGNAIGYDARHLWRFIRTDGGWWGVHMLVHHWRPTFTAWEVEEALTALHNGAFLVMRPQPGGNLYGFTSDCNSLPGEEQEAA
ncbi:hypothetical protein [Pseudacidovorax intermedius]|uniref:hypothetical protein n=1 Tax=Pseudacidovorax intermedius TaxID=433924 RepID=UPI0026F0FC52|nr:hypothetical protein [Pseudacidovorax intermedius]